MRPSQLLSAVVALSSVTAAWPDVFDKSHALEPLKNVIYGRQDDNESPSPSSTPTGGPRSTGREEESPRTTGEPNETGDPTGTGRPAATGKEEEESSRSGKATGSSKSTSRTKSIGADRPAGGVAMVTPGPLAGPQYYKVGDWVTFAWNYTSLSITPDYVDVLATCTKNQATYTIAVNQSVEKTNEVLWDTDKDKDGNNPLLTEMYTLLIYDAESSVSAMPEPGKLAPYNQFRFGLYLPQKYVPWEEFECANCNAAVGSLTLNALFITCGTTIGSLLFFAHSFGLF